MSDGGKTAITADGDVVSMADYKALQKKVHQLERILGRKTMEVDREKKLISRKPLIGIEGFQ